MIFKKFLKKATSYLNRIARLLMRYYFAFKRNELNKLNIIKRNKEYSRIYVRLLRKSKDQSLSQELKVSKEQIVKAKYL